MKNICCLFTPILLFALCLFASCEDNISTYDPYYNWQERNAIWFKQIADSARTAIQIAKTQYGDNWEQGNNCKWRMYKSLLLSQSYQSNLTTDSICVRINERGTGTCSPLFSDSVRVCFRGWLMPSTYEDGTRFELVFSQTYYGDYDANTSAPQLGAVGNFQNGFSTALQYMVEGDDWDVFIPQNLFYGSSANGSIPAYSTAHFRIQMRAIYPFGTGIPAWH